MPRARPDNSKKKAFSRKTQVTLPQSQSHWPRGVPAPPRSPPLRCKMLCKSQHSSKPLARQTSCNPGTPRLQDPGAPKPKFSHRGCPGYPKSPPNSDDEVGKAPGGGDCLRLEPSPTTELKGGFQRVPVRFSLPQTASRSGFGGAPTLHPHRLVAVTPISGPRACLLRRRRAWARALGARTAPGKNTYFAPSRGSSRPRCWRSWPQIGGCRGAGPRGLHGAKALFLLFFHTPAFLLPTLRGWEDGCKATSTSAA